jgi:hypothetical protein
METDELVLLNTRLERHLVGSNYCAQPDLRVRVGHAGDAELLGAHHRAVEHPLHVLRAVRVEALLRRRVTYGLALWE